MRLQFILLTKPAVFNAFVGWNPKKRSLEQLLSGKKSAYSYCTTHHVPHRSLGYQDCQIWGRKVR